MLMEGGRKADGRAVSAVLEARALRQAAQGPAQETVVMAACGRLRPSPDQESTVARGARSAGTGSKGRFERQDRWSGVEGDGGLPDSQPFPGDP